ncbi:MAG: IclR family transcriptional regulator [Lachnospiraceae bacterium]|nr:IclR family transcriptional regulator [Lachnospiraceae bacterium]
MMQPRTTGNQSGEKLLNVLEFIILKGEPQRLQDIANELSMNKSTTLRFLKTLVNTGYINQNPETSKYAATYKICALANKVNLYTELRKIARPYLEQLAKIFGESVNMAVEDQMTSVYVDVIRGSSQSLVTVQKIGNAAPMHCTGNGKVLLLNYTDEDLDRLIEVKGLTKYTEYTLTTKEALRAELEKIRKRGYAYDEQEREVGARCLAFPIYGDNGKVIAGMSVTGPQNRMTDEVLLPKLEEFRKITLEISHRMGYQVFE